MKIICLLLLIFVTNPVFAQDLAQDLPQGAKVKITDPELAGYSEDLSWHRWTTKNFTIMSISEEQGNWMFKNIEDVNTWCVNRWGINKFSFPVECRVFCVPNKELFKKLFSSELSKVEYRKNENIVAVWLVLDDKPEKNLPVYLTQAILYELEVKINNKISWALIKGMSVLNEPIADIKEKLLENKKFINNDTPMFFSKALLEMTEDVYYEQTKENRNIFDCQSAAFCLLLRKEFGEQKFLKLLTEPTEYEKFVEQTYGFKDYNQLDSSFKRYMLDLANDIDKNKTPDSYLLITPVKK